MIIPNDPQRTYLAKVLPWPEPNGTPAFINIHWTFISEKFTKPGWTGRAVNSIDEAVRAIEFALKGQNTRDVYVCMSSQLQAEEKTSVKGFKYRTPVRSQQNAVALKSLFLDIDFKGGDHGYDTPEEAVSALQRFIQDSGLPLPSCLVRTGGGLHVYWTIASYLTAADWGPLAFALAEATKRHGLKCDTQCTIDSARVLRVPGTFNRKSDPPRPVKLIGATDFDYALERLQEALEPYKGLTPRIASPLPPRGSLEGKSDLSSGIEQVNSLPIDVKSLIPECAFIRDAFTSGGNKYTNPLWNLTTLAATFMEDGRSMAHLMGRKHPGYSIESTNELYDRKEREKASKGLGWPHCTTISASGCTACQSCVHFPKGKSPLNFARRVMPPTGPFPLPTPLGVTHCDLPKGFFRDGDGLIFKMATREDGSTAQVQVCSYPMTKPWLQKNPWVLNFTTKTDHVQQISVPTEVIGTNEMRKHLQSQGLMLHDGAAKMVTEFFVSWIEKLKETKDAVVSTSPFGWIVENGRLEGFAFGGSVWTPKGSRLAPNPDPVTSRQYTPQGNISAWINAALMITDQKRPELNAILASSFAAPLVRFTDKRGLLMSTYSIESGIGKSTTLAVAQAVWGDVQRGIQSLSDTSNSVINKVGEVRSLPIYWDELKTEDDTRKFVNMVFQMAGGKERSRMTSAVKQREPGTWQTLMVSASNESLLDFVTSRTRMTTAGLYRVFEYEVTRGVTGQIAETDASRLVGKLDDNYGKVGLAYAQFLGANFARAEQDVHDFKRALDLEVQSTTDERFWTALIACLCVGARYANELQFTTIDEDNLKDFLLGVLGKMRNEQKQQPVDMKNVMNVSNVLAQFLNASRARHTLFTNRIHITAGKPAPNTIKVLRDVSKLDGIYVHIGLDDKIMRMSSLYLSDWLTEKGYSRHLFTKALTDEFGMRMVRGRMGSGTDYSNATEYLLEINLAGTALANFIDEV